MLDTLPAPAATAIKAVAGSLARQAITSVGMLLVSHGVLDPTQADSFVSPVADVTIGLALAAASYGWSTIRAAISHSRYANAWLVITGEKTLTEVK